MAFVYWTADGAGKVGDVPRALVRWIRANGSPSLIVNGGDVYNDGKPSEFERFFDQLDRSVADLCETPGNHDWRTTTSSAATGTVPAGYEGFWERFPPPLSRQPIDKTKRGGARYEHFIDLDGWRLIFLDTGPCGDSPWPMGDASRLTWLQQTLRDTPTRAKMVFAHHSRLSRGKHGDVDEVDALWQALFDEVTGAPLVALTLSGHDHNVSLYGPRPRLDPESGSVAFAQGIHVMVNGAGGQGHDAGFRGTEPDLFFDDDHFCVTRITLQTPQQALVEVLSFGHNDPPTVTQPVVVHSFTLNV